jgi:hypothetical protein
MRIPRREVRQIDSLSGADYPNIEEINSHMRDVFDALNWVEFGDGTDAENMAIDFVTITNAGGYAADAKITVPHSLKKVPTGYIIYNQSVAGSLYDDGTAWTRTNIYLKFSTAGASTIKIMIF